MARRFNGTSDFIDFGNILAVERTEKFSFGGWFLTTGGTFLIAKEDDAVNAQGYSLTVASTGLISFVLTNEQTVNRIKVTARRNVLNAWHHILVTYDGSSVARGVNIYIDGIADFLTIILDGLTLSTVGIDPFRFGAREANSFGWFAGVQADNAFWRGVELTKQDAIFLASPKEPGLPLLVQKNKLVGYWPLNGFNSPEVDLSGSGFSGTLTGTTRAAHPNISRASLAVASALQINPEIAKGWCRN